MCAHGNLQQATAQVQVGDSFRAFTIGLWGIQLGLTMAIIVYAVRLHVHMRRTGEGSYRMLLWWPWWLVSLVSLVMCTMATEVSWKTIFLGVGQDPTYWTYVNPPIYVITVILLMAILRIARARYVYLRLRAAGKIPDRNSFRKTKQPD